MKKFRFLGLLLIMLVTTFSFAACSDDDGDDVANASIVGVWYSDQYNYNQIPMYLTVAFQSNRQGYIDMEIENGPSYHYPFEYDYSESDYNGRRYVTITGTNLTLGGVSIDGRHEVNVYATQLSLDNGWMVLTRK